MTSMTYEKYKDGLFKAGLDGECVSMIVDRHINAVYMPEHIRKHANRYHKEVNK